jgi:hypothetical protein
MPEYQEVRGWRFPADVDVPEDTWSRGKAGGETFHVFHWAGYVDVARQSGLESVETSVAATGADEDGIPYVAARATVTIDGERYEAIGSADAPENSLSDMASTAQSRALKRAIRIALGIRRINESPDEPAASNAPDDFDPDGGHALADDAGAPADGDSDGW